MGGFSGTTQGEDVVFAKNVDFTGSADRSDTMVSDGDLLIGSTALNAGGTHINVGNLTSPDGSITVGYSSPNITLTTTSSIGSVMAIEGQDGVEVFPDVNGVIGVEGNVVANNTHAGFPLYCRVDTLDSSVESWDIQLTTAVSSGSAAFINSGISCFNDTQFTVNSSTGLVSLIGGSNIPVVQTLTGNDGLIVSPDANGNIDLIGDVVDNGTNPIPLYINRNSTTIENVDLQVSTAVAPTPADKNDAGICSFDDTYFTCDTNGFVSLDNVPPINPSTTTVMFDDFLFWPGSSIAGNSVRNSGFEIRLNGSTWTNTNASNHPGIFNLTTTLTGSITSSDPGNNGVGLAIGSYQITMEFMAKQDQLSATNPHYAYFLGFQSQRGVAPDNTSIDGIYFVYDHAVNSGNWVLQSHNNTTFTTVNTNVAADTNWHRYKMIFNAAGTNVDFYIDNVLVGSINSNIPTSTQLITNYFEAISGGASRTFKVDYWFLTLDFAR